VNLEVTDLYNHATTLGAKVQKHVSRKTTHLVVASQRIRTHKVRQAARIKGIKIVNQEWLFQSMMRWEKMDEEPFKVCMNPRCRCYEHRWCKYGRVYWGGEEERNWESFQLRAWRRRCSGPLSRNMRIWRVKECFSEDEEWVESESDEETEEGEVEDLESSSAESLEYGVSSEEDDDSDSDEEMAGCVSGYTGLDIRSDDEDVRGVGTSEESASDDSLAAQVLGDEYPGRGFRPAEDLFAADRIRLGITKPYKRSALKSPERKSNQTLRDKPKQKTVRFKGPLLTRPPQIPLHPSDLKAANDPDAPALDAEGAEAENDENENDSALSSDTDSDLEEHDISGSISPIEGLDEVDWDNVDDELAEFLASGTDTDGEEGNSDSESVASNSSTEGGAGGASKAKVERIKRKYGVDDATLSDGEEASTLSKKQKLARSRTTGLKSVEVAEENSAEAGDGEGGAGEGGEDIDEDDFDAEFEAEMMRELENGAEE
jgi:RNA polymerase II subunit A-like phosphatase